MTDRGFTGWDRARAARPGARRERRPGPGRDRWFALSATNGARQSEYVAFAGLRFSAQAGQAFFFAALLILTGTGGAGPFELSGVIVAMMVASVACGLPGGALADRLPRGLGLVAGIALRMGAVALCFAIVERPALTWLPAFAYSAASQVYSPSELALVPAIEARRFSRAHALLVALQYAGQGAALFVAAPLLYLLGGVEATLVGALATFLGCGGIAAYLAVRLREAPAVRHRAARTLSFGRVFRFYAREPGGAYALGNLVFAELATKCLILTVPLYLERVLRLTGWEIGVLVGPAALGAAAGLLLAGRRLTPAAAPRALHLAGFAAVAAIIVLVTVGQVARAGDAIGAALPVATPGAPVDPSLVPAVLAMITLGLCLSVIPIGARTIVSATVPVGAQGRAFAWQASFTDLVLVLPLLVTGLGAERAGPTLTLAALALTGLAFLLTFGNVRRRAATSTGPPALVGAAGD